MGRHPLPELPLVQDVTLKVTQPFFKSYCGIIPYVLKTTSGSQFSIARGFQMLLSS